MRKALLIVGGAFVTLIMLIVVVSVATSGKSTPSSSTSTPPKVSTSAPAAKAASAPTVTQTVTAPPPAATAPAAPPADTVIARFSGTSSGNTGSFTVPADGNWHLSYAYTNGSLFAGQAENFGVTEYGTDGTYNQLLVYDLAVGTGQPTAVPVYSDSLAGSQAYFQVNTEDASWSLVVLTGTS